MATALESHLGVQHIEIINPDKNQGDIEVFIPGLMRSRLITPTIDGNKPNEADRQRIYRLVSTDPYIQQALFRPLSPLRRIPIVGLAFELADARPIRLDIHLAVTGDTYNVYDRRKRTTSGPIHSEQREEADSASLMPVANTLLTEDNRPDTRQDNPNTVPIITPNSNGGRTPERPNIIEQIERGFENVFTFLRKMADDFENLPNILAELWGKIGNFVENSWSRFKEETPDMEDAIETWFANTSLGKLIHKIENFIDQWKKGFPRERDWGKR